MNRILPLLLIAAFFFSCKDVRVKEHDAWAARFKAHGIDSGCFIMRDHSHETLHLYNKARCLTRYTPASTFKIFNSLVALETGVARDERLVIPWDGIERWNPEWSRDMDMREAFRVSSVPYYQEIARRVGRTTYQRYLDTVKYGNMKIGREVEAFWLDNSLQISADEQVGFIRKLYFNELPFLERTQGIVKNIMLREDSTNNRFYYKTGSGSTVSGDKLFWIVGFMEHMSRVKEPKGSMNKSGVRNYPYFFALNFEVPPNDSTRNWYEVRTKLLHELLDDYGATRD